MFFYSLCSSVSWLLSPLLLAGFFFCPLCLSFFNWIRDGWGSVVSSFFIFSLFFSLLPSYTFSWALCVCSVGRVWVTCVYDNILRVGIFNSLHKCFAWQAHTGEHVLAQALWVPRISIHTLSVFKCQLITVELCRPHYFKHFKIIIIINLVNWRTILLLPCTQQCIVCLHKQAFLTVTSSY